MTHLPLTNTQEMIELYMSRGMSRADADTVMSTLMKVYLPTRSPGLTPKQGYAWDPEVHALHGCRQYNIFSATRLDDGMNDPTSILPTHCPDSTHYPSSGQYPKVFLDLMMIDELGIQSSDDYDSWAPLKQACTCILVYGACIVCGVAGEWVLGMHVCVCLHMRMGVCMLTVVAAQTPLDVEQRMLTAALTTACG